MAGIDIVHISYKGTVLALNDLIAGQVQLMFSDMPIALPHAKSGKLRAIAVTGARRTPLVPDMPTVAEAGMPGYALDNWWGILAPRGIPRDVAAKLTADKTENSARRVFMGNCGVTGTSAQLSAAAP